VFKVDPTGTETVLYSFTGGADGGQPSGGVIRDRAGNLYGTTIRGGALGFGVVFKLDTAGTETVLHNFGGAPADGASPYAGVILDSAGNLYGTTQLGGASGYGVVYKLNKAGKETVLHSFAGCPIDGEYPKAGVIRDPAGNLYGTTYHGGTSPGSGVVFRLDSTGTETVLFSFNGGDGSEPKGGVIRNSAGNLYGTTSYGGTSNPGVVFEIQP
jgi:uncharacterized repeat protein (TIGR03803 family)